MYPTASKSYYTHPNTLKAALQAVAEQNTLADVSLPEMFPDCRLLQSIFEWLYCCYYHINAESATILSNPHVARRILHSILRVQSGDDGAQCFHIEEGDYHDIFGRIFDDRTWFKVSSDGRKVTVTQLESDSAQSPERSRCVLDGVSLADLKIACLREYIKTFTQNGELADLTTIPLDSIDVGNIELQNCVIPAPFVRTLEQQGRVCSLKGARLSGTDNMADLRLTLFKIDPSMAAALLENGADQYRVLWALCQTERELHPDPTSYSGINVDITGLEIDVTGINTCGRFFENFQLFAYGVMVWPIAAEGDSSDDEISDLP